MSERKKGECLQTRADLIGLEKAAKLEISKQNIQKGKKLCSCVIFFEEKYSCVHISVEQNHFIFNAAREQSPLNLPH